MKTNMFPLMCTLVVVAFIGIAYAGLTADQAQWVDLEGAGCTYEHRSCNPPDTPSCGRCWVGVICTDKTSGPGTNATCRNVWPRFTGMRDIGTQACGSKMYKDVDCRKNWVGFLECVCIVHSVTPFGPELQMCKLSVC